MHKPTEPAGSETRDPGLEFLGETKAGARGAPAYEVDPRAPMNTNIDPAVIARAKQNFKRRHARDRAWDVAEAAPDGSVLCLTEAERTEFLAQAQYEIASMGLALTRGLMLGSARDVAGAHGLDSSPNPTRPAEDGISLPATTRPDAR